MRSRTLRISDGEGGSRSSSSSASAPEPTGQERTASTPLPMVPRITSVEPPPTSTTPILPLTGCPSVLVAPMKERRPSSFSLRTSTSTPETSEIAWITSSRLRASRMAAVATGLITSAPSSSARRTWVATTSPTSWIFGCSIAPSASSALLIRV